MALTASRKRARDADRTAACDALDAAFGEGQIDGVEHRTRTAAALRAVTLGELQALTADLQTDRSGHPAPEIPPRVWAVGTWWPQRSLARTVVGAMATGAFLVVAIPMWVGADGPGPAPGAGRVAEAPAPRVVDAPDPRTPAGFARMVDDVRATLGGTAVDRVAILSGGTVVVQAAEPGRPWVTRTYDYRGGLGTPRLTDDRDPGTRTVDLASVDAEAVLGLLAGAPRTLEVAGATTTAMTVLDAGSGPRVDVTATGDGGRYGRLVARPDGTVVTVEPYRPPN